MYRLKHPPTMSGRMKRALSPNSQAAAEALAKMKKVKGNDMYYMQPPAVTQERDMMEVDSHYAAQEHRCDGSFSPHSNTNSLLVDNHHPP